MKKQVLNPEFDDVIAALNAEDGNKKYCNACGFDTPQDEDGCVYHQRVKRDSDGVPYLKYDEFNQDGSPL